jgi:D-glycero-beta-D-manno-heptose-7-phosphate kinase
MKITAQDRQALLGIIERIRRQRVVVLGDLVADEFVHGEIACVSREAPVLILKEREKQVVPGGGANAANNLAALGARTIPVGVVGDDEAGEALLGYFRERGVPTRCILRVRDRTTPAKCRILGSLTHWQHQQIVRVDREPSSGLSAALRRELNRRAASALRDATALLVSDYGYGTTGPREVAALRRRLGRRRIPVTVDSRFDIGSYSHVTAATPNEPEVEARFGKAIGDRIGLLFQLGRRMLRQQHFEALLVTRGRDGMVLFEPRRPPRRIPVFGLKEAVDVTGAGDTVIAAFTLALSAGACFFHAAQFANCAGGLVVMKRGTATVTAAEIREAIRNE